MKKFSNNSKESGFSLIEVAIGLMVIGILMVPIIRTYNLYIETKKGAITNSVTTISKAAILKYFEKYGVYPVPADPGIPMGTAGFGMSATMPVAGWPVCTATSTVVCQTGNTTFGGATTAFPGRALIGDVPFAVLGIPYKSTVDGYGRKLKYAVTRQQTVLPFNDNEGVIEVLAQNNPTPTSLLSIYRDAATPRSHFVLASMGQNGMGGFTLGGRMSSPCNIATAPVPDESENCDNDGIFRSNIDRRTTNNGTFQIQRFDAGGARRFDDYVVTTNSSAYGIWSFIPNTLQDMQARNGGNIRIGACTSFPCVPSAQVDVAGSVSATNVQTSRICLSAEGNCTTDHPTSIPRIWDGPYFFSPSSLTGAPALEPPSVGVNAYSTEGGSIGAGIRCYRGGALKGIRNYDEVCAQSNPSGIQSSPRFINTTTSVTGTCTGTNYAVGITINGTGEGFSWICGP